jgi:hypothetical protein
MLLILLLDALSSIGEGEAILTLGKWFLIALLLVLLLIGPVGYLWSRDTKKQSDLEPKETQPVKPAKQARGARFLLWMMVAVMVVSFVALSGWS